MMSSADEKLKIFDTSQSVSGSAAAGKEPDPEKDRTDGRRVDSSKFIQAVYEHFEVGLPRSYKGQAKILQSGQGNDQ